MSYKCEFCNYETIKPFNYDRHLKSKRHLLNETAQNETAQKVNIETAHNQIETTRKQLRPLTETAQNETAHDYGNYRTVQFATDVIEPEPEEQSDTDISIIGDTLKNVNKESTKVVKSYKPSKKVNTNEVNGSMAIVFVSLLISAVIIYVLFRDKINEFLGIGDNNSSMPVWGTDNTTVIR